jgi:hypothetical protein
MTKAQLVTVFSCKNIYLMSQEYVNGSLTGLVTFCVETAFYNGLLKERYKGG